MSALNLFDKYGPWVGLFAVVVLMLIPIVRDKVIPSLIQDMIERRNFQRQIEVDRLKSAERTDQSIQSLAAAMVQTNERMLQILNNQTMIRAREEEILAALNDGMTAMRERVAAREGYERGRKEHKKGDTGPLEAPKNG